MEISIIILLLIPVIFSCGNKRKNVTKLISSRITKEKSIKNKGEVVFMKELATRFIEKECFINTINSQMIGTIKEVTEKGLLLENSSKVLEAINLDYVLRICEIPRKKNGKKKMIY